MGLVCGIDGQRWRPSYSSNHCNSLSINSPYWWSKRVSSGAGQGDNEFSHERAVSKCGHDVRIHQPLSDEDLVDIRDDLDSFGMDSRSRLPLIIIDSATVLGSIRQGKPRGRAQATMPATVPMMRLPTGATCCYRQSRALQRLEGPDDWGR